MSDSERMKFWFGKNQSADDEIRDKFGADLEAFGAGELDEWRDCPLSAAAGIILGDQFTRHVYRGSPKSFDFDPRVREWTLGLVKSGEHRRLPGAMRLFVLLPLTHHENLESHEVCTCRPGVMFFGLSVFLWELMWLVGCQGLSYIGKPVAVQCSPVTTPSRLPHRSCPRSWRSGRPTSRPWSRRRPSCSSSLRSPPNLRTTTRP